MWDISAGIGSEEPVNIMIEYDKPESNSSLNPYLSLDFGTDNVCLDLQDFICIKGADYRYVDIGVGVSFYTKDEGFNKRGHVHQLGLRYRAGARPRSFNMAILYGYGYKFLFWKNIYFKPELQLDFGGSRIRSDAPPPQDVQLSIPDFDINLLLRLGYQF